MALGEYPVDSQHLEDDLSVLSTCSFARARIFVGDLVVSHLFIDNLAVTLENMKRLSSLPVYVVDVLAEFCL